MTPTLVSRIGLATLAAACCFGLTCADDDAPASTSTCLTEGPVVEILDNHRTTGGDHKLVVTSADVVAGVLASYDIRGDNTGHTHEVTLTADDFADLANGRTVTVISSNNGSAGASHTHEIRLSCP